MTISGGRPRQNDARLDGISVNDYANGSPGSALGVNLGSRCRRAVHGSYEQLSGTGGPIFGRSGLCVTRKGTNYFHGTFSSSFETVRWTHGISSTLRSRPSQRNQFGASPVGLCGRIGPSYSGTTRACEQVPALRRLTLRRPPAARSGTLCDRTVTDCSKTISVAVDSTVLKFVNTFWPVPNGPLQCPFPDKPCLPGTGDTGVVYFCGTTDHPENYFTTKIDHKLSTEGTLSGTYMFDSGTVRQPDELNNKLTGYDSRRQFLTVSEAHTFSPRILNSIRLGIYRVVATTGLTFASGNPSASDPSFGTVPGHNAAEVTVPGVTGFTGGLGTPTEFHFHWTSIQAYDDISWVRGNHALRFGLGIERIRDNKLGVSDAGRRFSFQFNF